MWTVPIPACRTTDRDGIHEIYRSWRSLADSYGGRALIGETPDDVSSG